MGDSSRTAHLLVSQRQWRCCLLRGYSKRSGVQCVRMCVCVHVCTRVCLKKIPLEDHRPGHRSTGRFEGLFVLATVRPEGLASLRRACLPVFGKLLSPGFIVSLSWTMLVDTLPASDTLGFHFPSHVGYIPSVQIPFLRRCC